MRKLILKDLNLTCLVIYAYLTIFYPFYLSLFAPAIQDVYISNRVNKCLKKLSKNLNFLSCLFVDTIK